MKRIFKVHKDAKTIRLTKDLVAEGFDGELEGFMNACTFILVKPDTTLDEAIESLETTIRDLHLRKKMGQKIESKLSEEPKTQVDVQSRVGTGFDELRNKMRSRGR